MTEYWQAVLARLGTRTGDGRILAPGGITNRDLPMPLMWQEKTAPGHDGAVTVGAIESISYSSDTVTAAGSFLDEFPDRERVFELIRKGIVGPSVDLADNIEYQMDDDGGVLITQAGIGGVTLVPIEAFSDVSIHMTSGGDSSMLDEAAIEAADKIWPLQASASVTLPPLSWFTNPNFEEVTPITITDDGRVFGHIAPWGTCHVGLPGCVTAPSSPSEYAYFLTGSETTAEGVEVPVGKLTIGGGHADPESGFRAAAEHYDDAGTAVASVFAGEDEYGIWVSGYVIPGTSHDSVKALQRSPISGDWRRIGGNLELIAAHAVNVPGFPIPRARVKFSSGHQISLISSFSMPAPKVEEKTEKSVDTSAADEARVRWAWNNRKGR